MARRSRHLTAELRVIKPSFEGENRYDGRVITNRPLPMAPFTSIGTMWGQKHPGRDLREVGP